MATNLNMHTFKFRPHHLICNLCFIGKGYNNEFIQNFQFIHTKLSSGSDHDTKIQIVNCCDDICAYCPENQGNRCNQEKTIDSIYLNILQLKVGQIITIAELKHKIKTLLTMPDFHHACQKCSWYQLNICTPIIQKIVDTTSK